MTCGTINIAREERMRKAVAEKIELREGVRALVGAFRFTEWEPEADAANKDRILEALDGLKEEGVGVWRVTSYGGRTTVILSYSQIPKEIQAWFEHFEKKGIPAAILKKKKTKEYAVFREGEEAFDPYDPEAAAIEPFYRSEVVVIRSCHGFKIRTEST